MNNWYKRDSTADQNAAKVKLYTIFKDPLSVKEPRDNNSWLESLDKCLSLLIKISFVPTNAECMCMDDLAKSLGCKKFWISLLQSW